MKNFIALILTKILLTMLNLRLLECNIIGNSTKNFSNVTQNNNNSHISYEHNQEEANTITAK